MKNTQQNLIATVTDGNKKNNWSTIRQKHPRVYLAFPNSDKIKTIEDMFMLRYNKPTKSMTNIVKNSLSNYLMNQLVGDHDWNADRIKTCIKLSWSQYAGCSCPCSPGYIAKFSYNLPYSLLNYESFGVKLDLIDLPII